MRSTIATNIDQPTRVNAVVVLVVVVVTIAVPLVVAIAIFFVNSIVERGFIGEGAAHSFCEMVDTHCFHARIMRRCVTLLVSLAQ